MRRVKKRKKIYDVRVWPTWALVAFAWLIARLPIRIIERLARILGAAVYTFGRSRRHITLTNLRLCFPDLSDAERERLARESFVHTAMGALEAMVVWLNPGRDIAASSSIEGRENLERARAAGRGVVVLGGHFSVIDVMGPKMAEVGLDVIYRENKNPVWEWLQVRGRSRYFGAVIERSDTRQILRRLREGHSIWYAADQDYGPRQSVFAPFFGIPTASIRATARLARFNHSPVLLVSTSRDLDALTWTASFGEVLTDYPTGDDEADAAKVNLVTERAIREHPEQYLWMHRRFKTRPPGQPSFYRSDD
ncbi:MAG: lipid A biosynthesis lauroyl acyltransferase [Pseudomonadales bacterium]|jgi:KDO2-lipid IV(A) lauroyltransferase